MLKRFLMFCIIFLIFGKKSIICAEDLILREKNFHVKKCYNMYLKRFFMCCRPYSRRKRVNHKQPNHLSLFPNSWISLPIEFNSDSSIRKRELHSLINLNWFTFSLDSRSILTRFLMVSSSSSRSCLSSGAVRLYVLFCLGGLVGARSTTLGCCSCPGQKMSSSTRLLKVMFVGATRGA